jgi:hypothetical protein
MLYTTHTLKGCALHCRDGEIGSAQEFYFDDKFWTIRYLVAKTGGWLSTRKVLLSPFSLRSVDPVTKQIQVDLTKRQIEDSPGLESEKPVSRQFEESYYGYYGWPTYWNGPYSWGQNHQVTRDQARFVEFSGRAQSWDPHLRSTHAVHGYRVDAADGKVGHVADFVIEDESWAIRYLVLDTDDWLAAGRRILVSPQWIKHVSWSDSTVLIRLDREAIEHAPEYLDDQPITRHYEAELHRHYAMDGYWTEALA